MDIRRPIPDSIPLAGPPLTPTEPPGPRAWTLKRPKQIATQNRSGRHLATSLGMGMLLALSLPSTALATWLELSNVWVVTRLPHETIARPVSRTSVADAPIQVHLVLEGRAAGQLPTYFTDAPGLDLGRGAIPASQLRRWKDPVDGEISLEWSQIEPEAAIYDNLTPSFHLAGIKYQEVPLPAISGKWTWEASVHPTLLPDQARDLPTGLGIMRYKVRVKHQDYVLETPGSAGTFDGGIGEEVPYVAYRGPDAHPLVSWAQSRFNMPYVAGASKRGRGDDSHQAFLGLGADSVELLPAAWRLAGHTEVGFVGEYLLDPTHENRSTIQLSRIRPEGERYVDTMGEGVVIGPNGVQPGDLLRSGKEAGIFARDVAPLGVLDSNDLVVTALFHEARVASLAASIHGPLTVLRWNEVRELQLELKTYGLIRGEPDGKSSPDVWAALQKLREKQKLPKLDDATIVQAFAARGGLNQVLPPTTRMQMLRTQGKDLPAVERAAMLQRILGHAAEALGPTGEAAFTLAPPRRGLPATALTRAADEPFAPQEEDFWSLTNAIPRIAQSFPVADQNRDGMLDLTSKPVEFYAAGPGLVLWTEDAWSAGGASDLARAYGNQVWIYLPRLNRVMGYLHMGDVRVKAGDAVTSETVLGTIARTGSRARAKSRQTMLLTVAFSAEGGRIQPVDPAAFWEKVYPAHPYPWLGSSAQSPAVPPTAAHAASVEAATAPAMALTSTTTDAAPNATSQAAAPSSEASPAALLPEETHLANLRQLTFAGENAEAYFSFDGKRVSFQSKRDGAKCDRIYSMNIDGSDVQTVSSGMGATTCAYYLPDGKSILYGSTHLGGNDCPPPPDMSQGYIWALYDTYDIFKQDLATGSLTRLTDAPGYDAEATISPDGKTIIFTSVRDGDIELYTMDVDGKNVKRLTHTPGYDGGAFFSHDSKKIVWRASRPEGAELEEFQSLLKKGLVRPSKLEIYVSDADGKNVVQLTSNGKANFAPYFLPDDSGVLFVSNMDDPKGRNFDIYQVGLDGKGLKRITHNPSFDGFPMFSRDGKKLIFASNRGGKTRGDTNLFIADWVP